nr:immunoglobulin heavy chain junction region [Mus musculus]MBK4189661.1 immunoglobulin heavy chain junction region [Mus musculus]MBK4189662.1 immunoglobulin heavy chain junction region [Mus musculus]
CARHEEWDYGSSYPFAYW